jgi:hypothetical protein
MVEKKKLLEPEHGMYYCDHVIAALQIEALLFAVAPEGPPAANTISVTRNRPPAPA